MSQQIQVLILQGGGALGAYQAGVYEQLAQHDFSLDWIIGTSIGAINAALIAGNQPQHRISKLKEFWSSLAPQPMQGMQLWEQHLPWMNVSASMNTMGTLMQGVDGFFKPRAGLIWDMNAKVPLAQNSFYDTSPLKSTLEKYIDFDYLNDGPMRISVCAVDLDSGRNRVFDNKKQTILPEHIMASGALPPGFPAIEIEGKMYWDGGIYSNSPLEVFLEEGEKHDALCFMVDLWDPTEARPTSMAEALARFKNIQYASRSKDQLAIRRTIRNLQHAIRVLGEHVPAADRKKLQSLVKLGSDHTINVVHLIMKALPDDHYFKDIDFSAATVEKRWQMGLADAQRALQHAAWLQPLPEHAGLIIHELPQERGA
ncbi:MAG: patatin-like phospholipase family protein [Proteobacteria bacterium]|nr:patatin-like phospholipase family protein [Pseudomonadota bacterium]